MQEERNSWWTKTKKPMSDQQLKKKFGCEVDWTVQNDPSVSKSLLEIVKVYAATSCVYAGCPNVHSKPQESNTCCTKILLVLFWSRQLLPKLYSDSGQNLFITKQTTVNAMAHIYTFQSQRNSKHYTQPNNKSWNVFWDQRGGWHLPHT